MGQKNHLKRCAVKIYLLSTEFLWLLTNVNNFICFFPGFIYIKLHR